MNYEEALKEIDDLVFAKTGRRLDQLEKIVLEAAWEDKDYSEIASLDLPYSLDHLRSNVGRSLWLLLTGVLGSGEKVTKKRLREIVERRMATRVYYSISGISQKVQVKTGDTSSRVLGEQPPNVSRFYGRVDELKELRGLIAKNRCVALVGTAGIGKSTLAAKLILEIEADPDSGFDCLCWKYIRSDFSPHDLVTELIGLLASPSKQKPDLPPYTQGRISVLIDCLKSRRCLLVLDGVDAGRARSTVSRGDAKKFQRHLEFRILFERLMEEEHQSCCVLTGRERLNGIDTLKNKRGPGSWLEVKGLNLEEAKQILRANNLKDEEEWEGLIKKYGAIPLALEIVSSEIQKNFNGRIGEFYKFTSLTANLFQGTLDEQFQATNFLGSLERQIIVYLAEALQEQTDLLPQATFLSGLKAKIESSVSTSELLEKIEFLRNLSLIERSENVSTGEVFFSLQPLLKRYVIRSRESLLRGIERSIRSA